MNIRHRHQNGGINQGTLANVEVRHRQLLTRCCRQGGDHRLCPAHRHVPGAGRTVPHTRWRWWTAVVEVEARQVVTADADAMLHPRTLCALLTLRMPAAADSTLDLEATHRCGVPEFSRNFRRLKPMLWLQRQRHLHKPSA